MEELKDPYEDQTSQKRTTKRIRRDCNGKPKEDSTYEKNCLKDVSVSIDPCHTITGVETSTHSECGVTAARNERKRLKKHDYGNDRGNNKTLLTNQTIHKVSKDWE